MGLFNRVMSQNNPASVGNESDSHVADAGNENIVVASASAALAESMTELATGEAEGLAINFEMNVLEDGLNRIDAALTQIDALSIGMGAKPALSSESLAILNTTLLRECGVVSTGNESSSALGPVEATEEVTLGLEAAGNGVWDSIKKTFFQFLDWITKQFNSVFGSLERLKAKAKALNAKEEKFSGTVSNESFDVPLTNLAKGKGGTSIAPNLAKEIELICAIASSDMDKVEAAATEVVDTIGDALDESAEKWGAFVDAAASSANSGPKPAAEDEADNTSGFGILGLENESADGGNAVSEEVVKTALQQAASKAPALDKFHTAWMKMIGMVKEVGKSGQGIDILGNRTIETSLSGKGLGSLGAKMELKHPTKALEAKPTKPMSRSDIGAVTQAIETGCDDLIASRKKLQDTQKFKSTFNKLSNSAESKAKEKDFSKVSSELRAIGKCALNAGTIANGEWRRKVVVQAVKSMDAALSYADKSLRKA